MGVHLQPPVWHGPPKPELNFCSVCWAPASASALPCPHRAPSCLALDAREETGSFFAGGSHLSHTRLVCD